MSEGIQPGASIDTVSSSGNHTNSSGDLQAIEPAEILRLLLKECPLKAIVVGGKGTGEQIRSPMTEM